MFCLKLIVPFFCVLLLGSCQAAEEVTNNTMMEQTNKISKQEEATTPAEVFGEMTEEEKKVTALLGDERDTIIQLLSDHFDEMFVDQQIAVTTGLVEKEGKVLVYFDRTAEWREELERLIADSSASSEVALRPVEYAPIELREWALEIAAVVQQDQSVSSKVAGIDPEASEQAIYVLIKEELDTDTIDRILKIFPETEFVPVSDSTGFTSDG